MIDQDNFVCAPRLILRVRLRMSRVGDSAQEQAAHRHDTGLRSRAPNMVVSFKIRGAHVMCLRGRHRCAILNTRLCPPGDRIDLGCAVHCLLSARLGQFSGAPSSSALGH
jgi:hypothetical protein